MFLSHPGLVSSDRPPVPPIMHTPSGFTPGHALPDTLPEDALVFAFSGTRLLVAGSEDARPADTTRLPTWNEFLAFGRSADAHFLGELAGRACVAVHLDPAGTRSPLAPPDGWRLSGLRPLFFALPEEIVALAGRAFQIVEWDRTHRFCGHCGTPMRTRPGERARECPSCGHTAYPRVSPAMMVLVTRGRELLLARANRPGNTMFSALAGFVEPGETIEDCIHREVREEVGLEVAEPVYFGSQSWAFPHSLMIAFTAEYAGGEIRPDVAEIAEAHWFTPENMPKRPPSLSIAWRLIDSTAARLRAMPG